MATTETEVKPSANRNPKKLRNPSLGPKKDLKKKVKKTKKAKAPTFDKTIDKSRKHEQKTENDDHEELYSEPVSASEQLSYFLNHLQSAIGICVSSLELDSIKDTCVVELSQRLDQDVSNLGDHIKLSCGSSWRETLCEGETLEGKVDPGNPSVLVISSSALRSLELLRGLHSLTKQCPAVNLFSKHLKVEEQMKSEIEEVHTYQESDLWIHGIVCAFEFIRGAKQQDKGRKNPFASSPVDDLRLRSRSVSTLESEDHVLPTGQVEGCDRWVPIGWSRIAQLVQHVPVNREWSKLDIKEDHDRIEQDLISIKDLAPPYQEQSGGLIWWCLMSSQHSFVQGWFQKAKWMHLAVKLAFCKYCNCKLSSKLMVNLPYEVPVRVAGGLLFKLRTHSFGDRAMYPNGSVVDLCSWQAKNFLVTVVDLDASKVYVPGISSLKVTMRYEEMPGT